MTGLLPIFSLSVAGLLLLACTGRNPEYDPYKRIFVTGTSYLGSELSSSEIPGQVQCAAAAQRAELGGRWVPWLSSLRLRDINAIEEVKDVGPWYDMDDNKVFHGRAAMAAAPLVALRVSELRAPIPDGEPVWTGTLASGGRSENLCFDPAEARVWYARTPDVMGDVGEVGRMDGSWTFARALPCSERAHLICIEQ